MKRKATQLTAQAVYIKPNTRRAGWLDLSLRLTVYPNSFSDGDLVALGRKVSEFDRSTDIYLDKLGKFLISEGFDIELRSKGESMYVSTVSEIGRLATIFIDQNESDKAVWYAAMSFTQRYPTFKFMQ